MQTRPWSVIQWEDGSLLLGARLKHQQVTDVLTILTKKRRRCRSNNGVAIVEKKWIWNHRCCQAHARRLWYRVRLALGGCWFSAVSDFLKYFNCCWHDFSRLNPVRHQSLMAYQGLCQRKQSWRMGQKYMAGAWKASKTSPWSWCTFSGFVFYPLNRSTCLSNSLQIPYSVSLRRMREAHQSKFGLRILCQM